MRGVSVDTDSSEVDNWLNPNVESLLASLDLGETNSKAADIIRGLTEDSDVVVYGDYDVDGIASTTLAMELVLARHAHVRYFIPHRFNQGYGLHMEIAQNIAKRKCDLVIVVDCGSQDVDAVKMIRDSGIPVVVFDHHLVEEAAAVCDTMVNPQMAGDSMARKLCATGVIWCWAWQNELLPQKHLRRLLDVVALATVADCVSLSSPLNRMLVQGGLSVLRYCPREGLAILMEKLGITPAALMTEDLAMKIIPCLNAAGRLYLADLAVKILFPGPDLSARVDKIISLNRKRRELSTKILSQVEVLSSSCDYQYVLTDPDWSVGVLSSVASRICNERNTPVALVASIGGIMRGTLRMPSGGDAVGVLKVLSPMLNTWGGHRLAAGFSVTADNWQRLRDEMERVLAGVSVQEEKENLLYWSPSELDLGVWKKGEELGPFGMENPAPKFYFPNNGDINVIPIGRDNKHVKIDIGGSTLLGFGAAEMIKDRDNLAGWVYKSRVDTWRNITSLQFILDKMVVA